MKYMEKIAQIIESGCNQSERIGLKLEHFVCREDYELISYEEAAQCLEEFCRQAGGVGRYEDGNILGAICQGYSLSLEPGCKLEICIEPKESIGEILRIYEEFQTLCDQTFGCRGYQLLEKGVFPLRESGLMDMEEIPLLPQEQEWMMDQCLKDDTRREDHMMRATASTQISIDFSSEQDAMKKMRVLEKLAPILALLTESRGHLGRDRKWKKYTLGFQIRRGEEIPTVRLKQYLEYRIADSMPIARALGFAALVKTIVYHEELLDKFDRELAFAEQVSEIAQAENAVCESGYQAMVYGRSVLEWMQEIFDSVMAVCGNEERELIGQLKPLPLVNKEYRDHVKGREQAHKKSAVEIRDYLMQSTAKYHNRVVKTLYIPKLFTKKDTDYFEEIISDLFGIFDKVIAEYGKNPEYRKLFGFPKELEELILREKKYSCNIPMARADIFYDEETEDFKFCEFNTDGTSAMNEDRELNIAFSRSMAYQEFAENHSLSTFELFDTWVEEALCAYREYAGENSALPHVAIVDFMENATVNEFVIFKERFEQRGCMAEVCDIRTLTWDGSVCRTRSGMQVDVIYRRAVTTDIMAHYSEIGDFLNAVRSERICLLGDFRTQIVHNKILFKILHLEDTLKLLTRKEQAFVKAHVPLTISLDDLFLEKNRKLCREVYEDKDSWIIKPEDSYGSKGVCAGVELSDPKEWIKAVKEAKGKGYILQEFTHPYRLENIDLLQEDPTWITTSNMSGLFAYNHKFYGVYSRMSFEEMISTQYNEMSLPTILVQ